MTVLLVLYATPATPLTPRQDAQLPDVRPAVMPRKVPFEIRLARWRPRCTTLGPGTRAVVWVQGCSQDCPGCVAPETHDPDGGTLWPITELAERILAEPGLDGLSISGGEPFDQAAATTALVDALRAHRDLSVLVYTGYTLGRLRRSGRAEHLALLERCDLLIDGPYRRDLPTMKRWRGSGNQIIHCLSGRHRDLIPAFDEPFVAIDVQVDADGRLLWMGIPPPGMREALERRLAAQGIPLQIDG